MIRKSWVTTIIINDDHAANSLPKPKRQHSNGWSGRLEWEEGRICGQHPPIPPQFSDVAGYATLLREQSQTGLENWSFLGMAQKETVRKPTQYKCSVLVESRAGSNSEHRVAVRPWCLCGFRLSFITQSHIGAKDFGFWGLKSLSRKYVSWHGRIWFAQVVMNQDTYYFML